MDGDNAGNKTTNIPVDHESKESKTTSSKRKRSTPECTTLLMANVLRFVETRLALKTGNVTSTRVIQTAFMEEYHMDSDALSESSFQRMLKGCISSKFPDQESVYASRTTKAGERCRGYVGLVQMPSNK